MEVGSDAYQTLFNETGVPRGGVFSEGSFVPFGLVGGKVDLTIDDGCCVMKLVIDVRHGQKGPVDVVVASPLCGWVVTGWEAAYKGGKITSRQCANKTQAPHRHAQDVFCMKLPYRFHPNDTLTVTYHMFSFLTDVECYKKVLTVPQRFFPAVQRPQGGWESYFTVKHQVEAEGVALDATITSLADVNTVTSFGMSDAKVDYMAKKGSVSWRGEVIDDDITLEYTSAPMVKSFTLEVTSPGVATTHIPDEEHYAISLTIHPTVDNMESLGMDPQSPPPPNQEYYFLIDVSGSMHPHLKATLAAVELCIMSLHTSCRFNVITYGGGSGCITVLNKDTACTNDTENVTLAKILLRSTRAEPGGTSLYPALKSVYEIQPARGYGRQIIVLSNSSLKDPRLMLQLAQSGAAHSTIHTMCLKPAASDDLYQQISQATYGVHKVIDTPDDVFPEVYEVVEDTMKPALTDVSLSFALEGGADEEQDEAELRKIRQCFPFIPQILFGKRQTVYCFGEKTLSGNTSITMSAMLGSLEVRVSTHMTVLMDPKSGGFKEVQGVAAPAHLGAALLRTRMLLEPTWSLRCIKDKNLFLGPTSMTTSEHNEVLRLAVAFNIPTPLTVSVCSSTSTPLPLKEREPALAYTYNLPPDVRRERLTGKPRGGFENFMLRADDGTPQDEDAMPEVEEVRKRVVEWVRELAIELVDTVTDTPNAERIVDRQQADGSWHCDMGTATYLGVSLRGLRKSTPSTGGGDDPHTSWATACTLILLDMHHRGSPTLAPLTHKAVLYLRNHNAEDWIPKASSYVVDNSMHGKAVVNPHTD